MTAQTFETLHDDDPGEAGAWQPSETLARHLGVTARTVRNRAEKGAGVQKLRGPAGRYYYREAPPAEAVGSPGSDAYPSAETGAIVEALRAELARVQTELAARLEAAHGRTLAATAEAGTFRAEAAEARALAEVATRDAERLRAERQRATLAVDDLAAELARVRERATLIEVTAAELAASPWYAWRRRARARARLTPPAETSTPARALPGPRMHRPATVG